MDIAPGIPPSEFLTKDEVRDLTQRAHREAQMRELAGLGIPCLLQRGRVLVSRFHVRERLEGRPVAVSRGIDWSKVR